VSEFEPIYRAKAKKRKKDGGNRGRDVRYGKVDSGIHMGHMYPSLLKGQAIDYMAEDAPAGSTSVYQVLFIKRNDEARFEELKRRCQEVDAPISIESEHAKVKAIVDSKKEDFVLDKESVESLPTRPAVEDFVRVVKKVKPTKKVQQVVVKKIVESREKREDAIVDERQILSEMLDEKRRQASGKKMKKATKMEKLMITVEGENSDAQANAKRLNSNLFKLIEFKKKFGVKNPLEPLTKTILICVLDYIRQLSDKGDLNVKRLKG